MPTPSPTWTPLKLILPLHISRLGPIFERPAGESHCNFCSPGTVPTWDRSSCRDCEPFQFAHVNSDVCEECPLPRLLFEDRCIWWHLPLIALGVAAFMVALRFVAVRRQVRKKARIDAIFVA